MNKNKLAEFIKAFKRNVLKNKKKQSVGNKLQRWFTLSLVGAATVLPAKEANTMPVDKNFFPTNVTTKLPMRSDNKEDMATLETLRKETINHVVEIQSAKLQERIIHNIDSLQQEVLAAKRRGGRRRCAAYSTDLVFCLQRHRQTARKDRKRTNGCVRRECDLRRNGRCYYGAARSQIHAYFL